MFKKIVYTVKQKKKKRSTFNSFNLRVTYLDNIR